MKQYNTQFERLKVGEKFFKNGYKCVKSSTRTARIVAVGEPWHNVLIWLREAESVTINQGTVLVC